MTTDGANQRFAKKEPLPPVECVDVEEVQFMRKTGSASRHFVQWLRAFGVCTT